MSVPTVRAQLNQFKCWWPVWIPVPRRPWRLACDMGAYLRTTKGEAFTFDTAEKALEYLNKQEGNHA